VFLATPVMRTVDRMEFPSTSTRITCARRSLESLFVMVSYLNAQALSSQFARMATVSDSNANVSFLHVKNGD